MAGLLNKGPPPPEDPSSTPKRNYPPLFATTTTKARKAFDEAAPPLLTQLQREHDGEEEFAEKVTDSLEELDRKKGRKGLQTISYTFKRCCWNVNHYLIPWIGYVKSAPA